MHKDRALWVALVVLLLGFAAFMLRETGGAGWMPGCVFRKTTGFDCPGCGMTRASYAALNGNLVAAFRYNPVGMVLLPLALFALSIEVAGWVRGKPLPFGIRTGRWGATVLAVILIGWWILRNVFWKL
tara:strand:- start:18514 stop:18897 length:384 start_codon:yes stop_codon:yes gene_type:complete